MESGAARGRRITGVPQGHLCVVNPESQDSAWWRERRRVLCKWCLRARCHCQDLTSRLRAQDLNGGARNRMSSCQNPGGLMRDEA